MEKRNIVFHPTEIVIVPSDTPQKVTRRTRVRKNKVKHCNRTTWDKNKRKNSTPSSPQPIIITPPSDTTTTNSDICPPDDTSYRRCRRWSKSEIPHQLKLDPSTLNLRPKSEKSTTSVSVSTDENIVVSLNTLEDLIRDVTEHRECKNQLTVRIGSRKGLQVTLICACAKCGFETCKKMSKDCQRSYVTRGPVPASLNKQLALSCTKTKMGISDALFLLACLAIKGPSLSNTQKTFSQICDSIVTETKETLIKNQKLIRESNATNYFHAEVDASYNNQRQAGYEAGTIAFSPFIDTKTGLCVSYQVANKLCRKRGCRHENCKKTYGSHESMASCERKLTAKNLVQVEAQGILKTVALTSDASAQIDCVTKEHGKTVGREIERHTCLVHKCRSFQKAVKGLKLTSDLGSGQTMDVFKSQLGIWLRHRIQAEFTGCLKAQ